MEMAMGGGGGDGDGDGGLFDHIDDLLDFPNEDDEVDMLPMAANIVDDPRAAEPTEHAADFDGAVATCDDLDMAQLEWLSNFFDDSNDPSAADPAFASLSTMAIKSTALAAGAVAGIVKEEEEAFFSSCSPISVLEDASFKAIANGNGAGGSMSSSSSSSTSSSAISFSGSGGDCKRSALFIPARARSKRSRPAAPVASVAIPPPIAITAGGSVSDPESIAESYTPPPTLTNKKKKAKKAAAVDTDSDGDHEPRATARRCTHCQIEKTPQWRAGPMGPKTLCNACGVRYKSGRLFPEYRPAASPTFVPAIHSNSHKKVVEMRLKAAADDDSCDLLQQIRHI